MIEKGLTPPQHFLNHSYSLSRISKPCFTPVAGSHAGRRGPTKFALSRPHSLFGNLYYVIPSIPVWGWLWSAEIKLITPSWMLRGFLRTRDTIVLVTWTVTRHTKFPSMLCEVRHTGHCPTDMMHPGPARALARNRSIQTWDWTALSTWLGPVRPIVSFVRMLAECSGRHTVKCVKLDSKQATWQQTDMGHHR